MSLGEQDIKLSGLIPSKRTIKIAALALAALTFSVLAVLDIRYELLRPAPRISHETYFPGTAGVRVAIDPSRSGGRIDGAIRRHLSEDVPGWALRLFAPYSISIVATPDLDSGTIAVQGFINTRRLGPQLASGLNGLRFWDDLKRIRWSSERLQREARGVVTLSGSVPLDDEALNEFWHRWDHDESLTSLRLEGKHFIEAVFDNRNGAAYLVIASLLDAYDVTLNEDAESASLSSLQFVRTIRAELNPVGADSLAIRIQLDIKPEARDRIAVHNLKKGLDEGFEAWGNRLRQNHGLKLTGAGTWRSNVLDYDFRLESFDRAIDLLIEGKLF